MAQVTFEHVCKDYDGKAFAVKDFNLSIADGEFVVLVGPSGCGKSTTLRMLAGLEDISSGKISINGKCVNDVLPKDRNIAMVFQNYALYPDKTVYENMAFCLRMRKKSGVISGLLPAFMKKKDEDIDRRVREAAEILGITELLSRRPRELSGGQRQRVAVGRCIVRSPEVFLFDEPLSNLDAKMRVQMRTEISRLHGRLKATMLYVTHDQTEAMTMGDRIVVMKNGVIQQVATPAELYDRPCNEFVAGFIGTPPMNFLDGVIAEVSGKIGVQSCGTFLPLLEAPDRFSGQIGRHVRLGLRPEHIGIGGTDSEAKLAAEVEVVEPMGAETLLYMRNGNSTFISRADAHCACHVGEKLELSAMMASAHIFNAEDGTRI